VLPGTHSKWAIVEPDGRISWFATYMTGELFAVLRQHSILGRTIKSGPADDQAFARGVGMALSGGQGLFGRLFSARTMVLFGLLKETAVADYLSGLLIGGEFAEARHAIGGRFEERSLVLIGASALVARYGAAAGLAGFETRVADETAAAKGLLRIAGTAGLLQ
jgi:2-dehydro-3-deoxygalactonokinase